MNRKNRDNSKKAKKGNRKFRFIKKALKVILLLIFILGLSGSAWWGITVVHGFIDEAPELDFEKLAEPDLASYIYDINDQKITSLTRDQNRILVELDEIPEHVQQAFIALEDARFFEHNGFDPIGIVRALIANLRAGRIVQGASTITQQLARTTFLTPKQTIERKVQEVWLAVKLERSFTKEEILELYLNHIYFGNRNYGIEAAARTYFGKSVGDLALHEAALLAGIPRSPNNFNPFDSEELAEKGARTVLHEMLELGFISEEEHRRAINAEFVYHEPPVRKHPFPHFVDYVLHSELIEILSALPQNEDLSEEEKHESVSRMIYNEGIRVFTTLDPRIQSIAEEAAAREEHFPVTVRVDMDAVGTAISELKDGTKTIEDFIVEENGVLQPQTGIVIADPVTGEVKALVGGREYRHGIDEILRFTSTRHPGSAIKALTSYAPAFEKGLLSPGSVIDDAPFASGGWFPENYGGRFRGLVTAREALVHSFNIPAVRVFEMLTPQVGTDFAKRLGITFYEGDDADRDNLATALGGLKHGVTAWDMAQAHAVFANQGIKRELHTIRSIEDRHGKIIYEHRSEPEAVISPQTAYLITDVLKDVVSRGTAGRLNIGRPLAAKTGTANEHRTIYLVAYTPEIIVSLWIGYDKEVLGQIPGGSRHTTIPMMEEILLSVLEDTPVSDFTRPTGISGHIAISNKSGLRPGEHTPPENIVHDIFISGNIPQARCEMHVELEICAKTGLLATEYCPPEDIITEIFLNRPDYITTDHNWKRGAGRVPEDAALMPPTEVCDLHIERPAKPLDFNFIVVEGGIQFTWEQGDDTTVSYRLFRSVANAVNGENGTVEELLVATPFSFYIDRTFEPGQRYLYRLVALNKLGSHSESATLVLDISLIEDTRPPNSEINDHENNNGNQEPRDPNDGHNNGSQAPRDPEVPNGHNNGIGNQ